MMVGTHGLPLLSNKIKFVGKNTDQNNRDMAV